MRRGSGALTVSSSMVTDPLVEGRKPARTLSSVDLPQPDGPTIQTNSPTETSKLISSRAETLAPLRSYTLPRCCTRNLFPVRGSGTTAMFDDTNPPTNSNETTSSVPATAYQGRAEARSLQ